MTAIEKARRRRSPEEAKLEILDAAETVLLNFGPTELKFQAIAAQAGLSASNVHHHFGGAAEIKRALIDRMLRHLASELASALAESTREAREARIESSLRTAYRIISTERYAKMIAWLALSARTDQIVELKEPIEIIKTLVTKELAQVMPTEKAARAAPEIVFQVAITAIGEGLIGKFLVPALGEERSDFDTSKLLLEMVLKA